MPDLSSQSAAAPAAAPSSPAAPGALTTVTTPSTARLAGHRRKLMLALSTLSALAACWLAVRRRSARAEREYPPNGRFVEVDGVRLHYLDRGKRATGPVLLLLHGNVVAADDFRLSGLLERLSADSRVLAFDRPGFGYSARPRTTVWTPQEQARLLLQALDQLGVTQCVVLAHSWGTLVALAMGLQAPAVVQGLLLLSGYYYPSLRPDVPLAALPAMPVVGEVWRHTVAPLLGRATWPLAARGMFSPAPVPDSFREEDPWTLLRPSQLRAVAAEAALMVPAATTLEERYASLSMPVIIMAGADDHVISASHHSAQLHQAIPHSELLLLPEAGHMLPHLAQDEIVAAAARLRGAAPAMTDDGARAMAEQHAFGCGDTPSAP